MNWLLNLCLIVMFSISSIAWTQFLDSSCMWLRAVCNLKVFGILPLRFNSVMWWFHLFTLWGSSVARLVEHQPYLGWVVSLGSIPKQSSPIHRFWVKINVLCSTLGWWLLCVNTLFSRALWAVLRCSINVWYTFILILITMHLKTVKANNYEALILQ